MAPALLFCMKYEKISYSVLSGIIKGIITEPQLSSCIRPDNNIRYSIIHG